VIPTIDIRADLQRVQLKVGLLEREVMPAAVRAMNKTLTTVRAEATKELRRDYPGVKASAMKARMKLVRATRGKPTAAVVFSGSRFSLYGNFGMRPFGQFGVRFAKLPWRVETLDGDVVGPERMARAFRNRFRRGGRAAVFARESKYRLSQEMLLAPGIARAIGERRVDAILVRVGRARFAEVFAQEVRFILSKRS